MKIRSVVAVMCLALLAACGPEESTLAPKEPAEETSAAPAPRISFSLPEGQHAIDTAPTIDFGQVRVGTLSVQALVLANKGSTPTRIESIQLSGGTAFALDFMPALPFTLQPQSTLTLELRFQPSSRGQVAQTLTITSNDPANPTVAVSLQGAGVAPQLVVEPSPILEFGDVRVGSSKESIVTLSNKGTAPLLLTSLSIQGPPFVLLSPPPSPFVLAPFQSISLKVRFVPTAEMAFRAQLLVTTDDPAYSTIPIAVSGRGVKPVLVASTLSLDFGTALVGTSVAQTVRLQNVGSGDATISSTFLTGSSDFSLSLPPSEFVLAPGQIMEILVKYHPTQAGPVTGTLFFNTDEGAPPFIIDLKGQGSGGTGTDTALVWAPSALDFGAQRKGTTSTRLLTVTNEGTSPRILTSVALDGNAYPVFASTTLPMLPFFLAPGSSVQFQVTFNPVAAGAFASALTLTTTDPLNPISTVALTGTGTGTSFSAD
ncbi:choice-of-anchor D domain-containing protein [Melittangium boletus]|uniref:Choice-of-anchor D domain-containing protein n=1 Tax=Melittangium boletus DSM 14713 TaxID=1294270 RepID=A0A250IEC1_9BACT|nr:choice-of-anchor D domain-containing protein [Melittangium boletus]ATB29296.1 hypothetical protein MEBOL_002745 [Melittangium boletus DSM 14713]